MKKIVISKLFLYKHRFSIGYILLGLAFVLLLFALPLFAQNNLSEAEINSVESSYALSIDAPMNGDLVDLPYRTLQKASIMIFGLSTYSIKLPSIIIGLVLGLLLILLLNRWFKNNVSLLASCLVILSTPFLFLAGSGTPLIMLVFWPTLLLWLGSKIQGEKKPKPIYTFIFAISLLLSIFTPYMIYFAIFCVLFVFLQPHLRFIIKSLPKIPLILVSIIVAGGIALLVLNMISHPEVVPELLLSNDFKPNEFFNNIGSGLAPIFSWRNTVPGVFLSPLMSLPAFALVLIGLFSTTRGFFASRNSIATLLLIFTVAITGLNPSAAIFFILPFAILVAHGLKYLLEKWYGLFPENPYARVAAIFPLALLFGIILLPSTLQYVYGYRYNPSIASEFNYTLPIIQKNLSNETLLVSEHYDFYKILENNTELKIIDKLENEKPEHLAVLKGTTSEKDYRLEKIITSPMSDNSDIIYLYTYTEKGE